MSKAALIVQRIWGVIFILSGLGKFAPVDLAGDGGVDVQLAIGAKANEGTAFGPLMQWLADHPTFSIWLSAMAFILSGLVMVTNLNRKLVMAAAIGQIIMIACFMVLLHRAFSWILWVDPPFIAVSAFIFYKQLKAGDAKA